MILSAKVQKLYALVEDVRHTWSRGRRRGRAGASSTHGSFRRARLLLIRTCPTYAGGADKIALVVPNSGPAVTLAWAPMHFQQRGCRQGVATTNALRVVHNQWQVSIVHRSNLQRSSRMPCSRVIYSSTKFASREFALCLGVSEDRAYVSVGKISAILR